MRHISSEITFVKKGKRIISEGNSICDSIFIPLQDWMKLSDAETAGNLNCKGCKIKIGRWNLLDDVNCNCGGLAPTPSFRINGKSVDLSIKSAPVIVTLIHSADNNSSDEDNEKYRSKRGKGRGKKKR